MTKVDLFDYELPDGLIAVTPAERREEARLLVLDRAHGDLAHRRFGELPALLRAGDLLVLNDARVIPARLHAVRATGGAVEVLLVRRETAVGGGKAVWSALVKAGGRLSEGEVLRLKADGRGLRLLSRRPDGRWLVSATADDADAAPTADKTDAAPPADDADAALSAAGAMPLPAYIRRARRRRGLPEDMPELDRERYQTVYAAAPGAVAAPTAGLHFTEELLERIGGAGVEVRMLSLLVGPGTFQPVRVERAEDHELEAERFLLPEETARAVESALREGRRVVAVGTTTARVLEYVARRGEWAGQEGLTDLFIYPPFEFRAVGALITNFHLPRSSLLMLVAALAGRERILEAYRTAMREGYRFYSYGDAMLIC